MSLYENLSGALKRNKTAQPSFRDDRHFFAANAHYTAAAVLIPITDRSEPGVILTQRPSNMRSHPGQVAFPGGKVDPDDENVIAAALREAEEELAIPRTVVDIIGVVEEYRSGSGFAITPVLGLVPPDLTLVANPEEVDSWFEVPLEFILNPSNRVRKSTLWQGQIREYDEILWQDRRIWGVTAGIISNLAARLEWSHA